LLTFLVFLSRNARAQTDIKIGRRYDRLKAADQFAQGSALRLKRLASRARGHVRCSFEARPVPQFKFVNFTPRVAAFFISHDYTT
jgi:ATP phosphoribosyltransferase regulatory subunit HisZ